MEPIRLAVNQLLNRADPILEAYRSHSDTGQQAAAAMGGLEQRFAAFTVDINALMTTDSTLDGINAPYAHTYILEDAYLSALVAALPDGVLHAAQHASGTTGIDHRMESPARGSCARRRRELAG